jgi:hypothetical protein
MLSMTGGRIRKELLVSDYRTYAGAVSLTRGSSAMFDRCPAHPGGLRTKAERYRLLAETLLDPRVIAVVQACALDLETEALLTEVADDA